MLHSYIFSNNFDRQPKRNKKKIPGRLLNVLSTFNLRPVSKSVLASKFMSKQELAG